MKGVLFGLRLLWLLVSTAAIALVFFGELRDLLPAGAMDELQANRIAALILAWPEQRFWPLVFVAVVFALDALAIVTALRTAPNLTEVMRQQASPAKARTLLKLGEVRAAADTYLELGDVEKAAGVLAERGYLLDAGRMLIDHGLAGRADIHLLRVADRDAETAAALLEKTGQADVARELYRRAGAFFAEQREIGRAGRCFFKAGEHESARRYLADHWLDIFKPDAPNEVADILSAIGAHRDAALAYARAAQAAPDIETGRRHAKKAAALFAKGGDPAAGAAMLERSSLVADAAELYAHAGQIDKAVELLRSIKSGQRAAEILLKVGQTERAIDLFVEAGEVRQAAQVALQAGNFRTGALLLERVGDIDGAAQLLEQAGELLEAAEMMRNAGNTMRAAVLYERAGALSRAGAIYEAAGEEMRAASLYARGGDGLPAARLFLKNGRIREASQALGGVVTPESRPLHAELGARFGEIGESGLALEHLMAAIAGAQLDYANAGVYYHLGVLYEKLGDEATALDVFRRVYTVNPRIPDLAARI
ncbi:MAG: tetratricopeptide repeat protein, partial [Deltaproteobacteria bacterium]|nr:tetratricopeptide repeat protein [Deltaproteobacteria bacterium]